MKKLETKNFPSNGWNAETFQKHGKVLISNFVRIQRNHRRKGQKRLKRFLNILFELQIERVIKLAEKQATFKLFKSVDPWTASLTRVFMEDFEITGNMMAIHQEAIEGTYKQTKDLLAERTTARGLANNKDRAKKVASRVTGINRTTKKILRKEILNALKEGATVAETSSRLRNLMPRMRRRIPTIVRTEMGRATDEGVKQGMKESKVVTHCSVVGCEKEEPLFTYNGQSTCNVENVPIGEVDGIEFHINHTGAWIPSKFKSQKEIVSDSLNEEEQAQRRNPTNFPSKPRNVSRDSRDSHSRSGVYNEERTLVHQRIKNQITGNQTSTSWDGKKAMVLTGGALFSSLLSSSRAFKQNNPRGRLSESVKINTQNITQELPEWDDMKKASRMGAFEQNDAFLQKESVDIKEQLIDESIALGLTCVIEGIGSGRLENYKPYYEKLKSEGHDLEGHFQVNKNIKAKVQRAEDRGYFMPRYAIQRSLDNSVTIMDYVAKGIFSKFFLYDSDEVIFRYEDETASILNSQKYESYLLSSSYYNFKYMNFEGLPFLPFKKIIQEPNIALAKDTSLEPDAYECQIMAVEIITGTDMNDSQLQPFSEEYEQAWKVMEDQIAIKENLGLVLSFKRFLDSI